MSIEKNMNTRIQHKHDIEANWNKALNFIPKIGEIIVFDIDDKCNYSRFKFGDGVRTINDLEFLLDTQYILHNSNTLSQILEQYKSDIENITFEETDPTVPSWAKASAKPSYTKNEVGLGNVDNVKQYSASNPPPYPITSVNGKTGAVTVDVPTNVSQLTNDKGYLTKHQDISGKLDKTELPTAINTALAQAKASGEFNGKDGKDGYTPIKGTDYYTDAEKEEIVNDAISGLSNSDVVAKTKYYGASNSAAIYVKISDFGSWGTGNWTACGFQMLISSRAGELVWVSMAANDSAKTARAIRLMNTYTKISNIYYSVSENAIYVKAAAWCNNITAHLLSNINGDYVPTVALASALASDAVEINIVEFGINSSSTVVGDSSVALALAGSGTRPTYNGSNVPLMSDVPTITSGTEDLTAGSSALTTGALYFVYE